MKKLITVILTVCMALACAAPCFAQYESHTSGETKTLSCFSYLDSDGCLWMWGPNYYCQAGQEKAEWIDTPAKVMDHVVAYDHNNAATIILKDDGSVWTLGLDFAEERMYVSSKNKEGEVYSYSYTPEAIKRLDGCVAVAVGRSPCFAALKKDGTLYVWGDQTGGCLGYGDEFPDIDVSYFEMKGMGRKGGSVIKPFELMRDVKTVAMGKYMGLAVKNDGSLWYWGSAPWFGIKTYSPDVDPPQKILDGVVQACAGDVSGAVMADGTAWRWGGDRMMKDRVKIGDDVKKIACDNFGTWNEAERKSEYNTFVLKNDGTLWTRNGTEKIYDNVNDVYTGMTDHPTCNQNLVLLNDGTLIALKGSNLYSQYEKLKEDTVVATNVALAGKSFDSVGRGDVFDTVGGFKDVHTSDWFADAVTWAVRDGVTSGTSADTFSPSKECTVAEILTFLWASQGRPEPLITDHFSNVTDQWYAKAANWAYEQWLVEGSEFPASEPCTRYMAVDYMWKLEGCPDVRADGYYKYVIDVKIADDSPVQWALHEKITNGVGKSTDIYAGTYFGPELTCTRAQIIQFLYAAYVMR